MDTTRSNTFFDDESAQDIFDCVDQMEMTTPTPDNQQDMMLTASAIFGSGDASSLLTSSSTSITTRFMNKLNVNDEKENSVVAVNPQIAFQEKQVSKLMNAPKTSPVKPAAGRAGKKNAKKNKFKPTNLVLVPEEKTVNNNYNHNLNMEDLNDFQFSQTDYEMYVC